MKKILKMLVLGLLSAALLCCALPSAFAAEQKDAQIYTIGLDAMGGTSSVVAVTTNLNGKLSALPAQPTLDGYTFDGWYTETVGGTKVTTSTVFTGDTTVYAHWTVKSTAASSSTSTSKPAQPEQTEQDDGMTLSILTESGGIVALLDCKGIQPRQCRQAVRFPPPGWQECFFQGRRACRSGKGRQGAGSQSTCPQQRERAGYHGGGLNVLL